MERDWQKRGAIAGWVYTGITALILAASAYQTYLIRSNNIVVARAYVYANLLAVSSTFAHIIGTNEDTVAILFPIVNAGNTGTKDLKYLIRCIPVKDAYEEPWPFLYQGSEKPMPQFIAPHSAQTTLCNVSDEDLTAINSKKKMHVYVLGEIIYWDRINPSVQHTTQFSAQIVDAELNRDPKNLRLAIGMAGIGKHNCADEECTKN